MAEPTASAEVVALDACDVNLVDPERVHAVRGALPGENTVDAMATVFGLLSDPSRLRLLAALLEAGEMCVCDLAASTGSSESAVSHALRLLRANRVVRVRRAGRRAYYSLADSHVRLMLDVALVHITHEDDASASSRPPVPGGDA